ncbi:CBS domain-containing protein [Methylocystis sp. JAN1]|uniref:CBS domain-containing protein n=1 Tax=Methylocystis sp. JAN1 TaxID=3397211 RepID=UPI003FA2616F
MKIFEIMTRDVKLVSPDDTVESAAKRMGEIDAGALPVAENDRLVGMITDRDIAIRCVANGRGPATKVRDVMSEEVKYCFEEEDIEDVAENMGEQRLRRLPVLNDDKRLVGIVSLGDIAACEEVDASGEALRGISQPGGLHNQSGPAAQ